MAEWEDDGDTQAEMIAKFILKKALPCDDCDGNTGKIFECDYGHCLHGFCGNCKKGLFCMNNLDPSIIECPCCSDDQINFLDGKVPWYYSSFPVAAVLGWLSALLPEDHGDKVRSSVLEGMTRRYFPTFYDIKIPKDFNDGQG